MEEKKKKKSVGVEAPLAKAESKAKIEKTPPEKPKPGKLVRVNPGRLDRVKG